MPQLIALAGTVVNAFRAGSLPDPAVVDQLVSGVRAGLPASEVESLVRMLQPLVRGCDWPRYLVREGLSLRGLSPSEREDVEALRSGTGVTAPDEGNPVLHEYRQRQEGHERWAAAESVLVRRVEALVGADAAAVEGIAGVVGSASEAFLTLPKWPGEQLPTRLRLALPTESPGDGQQSAKLLHDVLRAVGSDGRALSQVIRLCGRELGLLFPDEVDPVRGTYTFRQTLLLLEDRLKTNPDDAEAVAWLAELRLRAGDTDGGTVLAGRLWTLTARTAPSDLARLVQFSLAHEWDYSEPRFDGEEWNVGLLGRLEGEWFDREEPLAYALLRRAFVGTDWNADLVQTVVELSCGWEAHDLAADLMPASGWVWAAHTFDPASPHYYRAWDRAFAAAGERGEGDIAILAVPHLLAGAVLGRCRQDYETWLAALLENATTPGLRRSAAQAVAGARNVEILPVPAGILVERLTREFAAEMAPPSDESAGEVRDIRRGLLDVDRQEPEAIRYLGAAVWERLSARTREMILQTLGVYRSFQDTPGERRGFGLVFVQLANAVVHEIDEQFSLALRLKGRRYFASLKRNKGPGDLWRLLDDLRLAVFDDARRDATILRRGGIRLDALFTHIPALRELTPVRNLGAHGEWIDREMASVAFGIWFEKGRLKELFEAIQPAS